jgi:hypothetical protein
LIIQVPPSQFLEEDYKHSYVTIFRGPELWLIWRIVWSRVM